VRFKARAVLLAVVAVFALSAVVASSALASGKPLVETKAATGITANAATLHGLVNPNGPETKYYFEYGTTVSYGSKTVEFTIAAGTSNVEKAEAIAGLAVNTKYHFRVVAKNSYGTTDGADEVLSTSATSKPWVKSVPANKTAETTATLRGVVNPNAAETKYYFEYGTSEAYGSKTAEVSAGAGTGYVEVSKAPTGLTANTTYYYRIVATNSHGTSDGAAETFVSTPVSGEAEFNPLPTKRKFTSTSGESVWDAGGEIITCTKGTISGEVTSVTTLGNVFVKYTGCTLKTTSGYDCPVKSGSAGNSEEVITYRLKGQLGAIVKASGSKVGLWLTAEEGKSWTELEGSCAVDGVVNGSLAGEVEELGKQTEHGLNYGVTGGKQNITELTLESGTLEKPRLSWVGISGMTIEQDLSMKFEEAFEIT